MNRSGGNISRNYCIKNKHFQKIPDDTLNCFSFAGLNKLKNLNLRKLAKELRIILIIYFMKIGKFYLLFSNTEKYGETI